MKAIVNELRVELRAAHVIIRNALGVATFDQKIAWGNANERDGVIGEGVTRAHERQMAIDSGVGIMLLNELGYSDRIIANIAGLLSPHQRELWRTAGRQDGVIASPGHPWRRLERRDLLDRLSKIDLLDLLPDNMADRHVASGSAAQCFGFDRGEPAGGQAAVVLKPVGELSAADVAALRRVLASAPQNPRVMLMTAEFDMHAFLRRQRAFSERTFGPGRLTARVCDHIRKELTEVEAAPDDLREWIDVILLGLDGAWRTGATPEQITAALAAKLTTNEGRTWPDWRTCDPDRAIEHVAGGGVHAD
ncbi:dATP/dGTP pyrophosphohydrolase domain-containing protein [Burkholderia pyrrocinia]